MKYNLLHRNKLYLVLLGVLVGMVVTFSQTVIAETIKSTNQSTASFTVDYNGGEPGLPGGSDNTNGGTTAQPNIPKNGQLIHYDNGQSNKGLLPQTGAVQRLTMSLIGISMLLMLIFLYRRAKNKGEGVV